jgi:hypothetical protein
MPTAPQHAIIIGAGMGGLLATRVLADVCAKVTRLSNVTPCRMPLGSPREPGRGTSRAARGETQSSARRRLTPGGYYAVCIVSA